MSTLSIGNPRSFLIWEREVVGLTNFYTDVRGDVIDEGSAKRVDIRFLSGDEIITASAPKDAFDVVRKVSSE